MEGPLRSLRSPHVVTCQTLDGDVISIIHLPNVLQATFLDTDIAVPKQFCGIGGIGATRATSQMKKLRGRRVTPEPPAPDRMEQDLSS